MDKKVLVIGGTGALGTYLTPSLIEMGYAVDVLSLDERISDNPKLKYIKADAKNIPFLTELLKNEYNAIVDFMMYFSEEEFGKYYKLFLENTDHYVFLSSYRIYADSKTPITEKSARILDVATDPVFLKSGDYCLYKAQEEDMLHKSGHKNYTILRPAITYSTGRYQLVTLEARVHVYRNLRNKTVVLPEPAMGINGTLSWAGDFGKMVARLILNKDAFGEVYTVSTAEHYTWKEIADIYTDICGMKFVYASTEEYLDILGPGNVWFRQQLTYDRYFNRAIDNTKILNATGFKQSDLMPLRKGLAMELSRATIDNVVGDLEVDERMDKFLAARGIK